MTEIYINKEFATYDDMLKWEDDHITEFTRGRPILMLNTESHINSDNVILKSVTVI